MYSAWRCFASLLYNPQITEKVSQISELGGPGMDDRSPVTTAGGATTVKIGVLTGFGPPSSLLPLQFKNGTMCRICTGSRALCGFVPIRDNLRLPPGP